jgi:uncharacterized protein YlxW (UPF0749 family)
MSIDTLAYSKTLEGAGLDRKSAEARAKALTQHILPDLLTKADLDQAIEKLDNRINKLENRLDQAVERLENRMDLAVERAEHRITLRLIGIVGAFDAALFALLRFVH